MSILIAIGHALWMSFTMFWDIFWGLCLGFLFSAIIEVAISKGEMSRLLPDDKAESIVKASALGAASSSCSYAAVAMARSIVRKGGNFTAAMAFELAATNLVLELGVLMWVLISWHFAAAEFIGGPIMIAVLVLLFRLTLKDSLKKEALAQAEKGIAGSMEGHAAMSMGEQSGTWTDRLSSIAGWVNISHSFVMNWAMLWRDIGIGLLVAGALGAWVPNEFWKAFFLVDHPVAAMIWGAFVGPLIAVISFTCSVGNVPLAAVLWNGGISFGGVAAFIFGDLIIPPILNIYRKYYGGAMTWYMLVTFYIAMVVAALVVELIFGVASLIPHQRNVSILTETITFNYTTVLNIIFAVVSAVLVIVFYKSGGPEMMKMMDDGGHDHDHHKFAQGEGQAASSSSSGATSHKHGHHTHR